MSATVGVHPFIVRARHDGPPIPDAVRCGQCGHLTVGEDREDGARTWLMEVDRNGEPTGDLLKGGAICENCITPADALEALGHLRDHYDAELTAAGSDADRTRWRSLTELDRDVSWWRLQGAGS